MRKLYLMRHAESPMSFDLNDKDRPLSAHGINQAKFIGQHLKNSPIDICLCSSAVRTKETGEALIKEGVTFDEIKILDEMYNASKDQLLDILEAYQDYKSIMIIAHNPGIHELARRCVGKAEQLMFTALDMSYRPATLSIFDCSEESYLSNQNKLIDLIIPE